MKLSWFSISWRIIAGLLFFLTVFAGPIFYILFADNLLDPLAIFAHFSLSSFMLRLLVVLVILVALVATIGYNASVRQSNPFEDLAASIRRIGMRDFQVRIGPYKFKEPREMLALSAAFNDMAAALQRSEELRNTMMADVAHELRTPLTILEGNLRAALDHVYTLDEAEIANLYAQTRHLIQLVKDLHELALADAHQLPLDKQPTDLADVVHETVQSFMPLAEEQQITLNYELKPLPILQIDVMRIRQVLHNLLTNALRHTPAGGNIRILGEQTDQEVLLAVTDTGDGLESEQLQAIFGRLYRTDRSRSRDTGGTGLGLAIANALIIAHGGSMDVTSPGLGQGCTFCIHLPAAA